MGKHGANWPGRWSAAIDGGGKAAFWLTYCVGFAAAFLAFCIGFLCQGKGFIWFVDGLEQQYMLFIQEGQWLRELMGNIASGSFELPMWSGQVGYGADYVYSLCMIVGNPINLVSVFARPENADLFLQATVPVTLFLAGAAFLWYCRNRGFDPYASLLGSLVYVFSGYSFIVYTSINLLYPIALMPLVIRGADRVFDRQSPLGLIASIALMFLAGVNVGYMTCLLLIVYCAVRYFFLPEKRSIPGFLAWAGRIAGCVIVGILISCALSYPLAINIVTQGRLGLEREYTLLYPLSYYISLLQGFMYYTTVGQDCMTGFAPIALVCVALLFGRKAPRDAEDRILIILFVVLTVALCLPIAGRVANGFAYPNNRWAYGYSFLVAVIVTVQLPKMKEASDGEGKRALAIMGAYAAICLATALIWDDYTAFLAFAGLVLALAICRASRLQGAGFKFGLIATVAVSCLFVSVPLGAATASVHVGFGRAFNEAVASDPARLVAELDSADSGTRYDTGQNVMTRRNGNWALGLSGSTFYNSYYNSFIDEYHASLGLASSSMNFSYTTFDSRTAMEALGGVEYFVTRSGSPILVPPAFTELAASGVVAGSAYDVLTTGHVLPLAYVSGDVLSRSAYDGLNMVERQEAMLQSVVLEDAEDASASAAASAAKAGIASHAEPLPYRMALSAPAGSTLDIQNAPGTVPDSQMYVDGSAFGSADTAVPETMGEDAKASLTAIGENRVSIAAPNTVVYLDVEIPAETEAYLCLNDVSFDWYSERDRYSNERWAALTAVQKFKVTTSAIMASKPRETFMYVYGDGMVQKIWQMNGLHHLYGGKASWAVNLGYSDEPRRGIAIRFEEPGEYTFGSIEVLAEDASEVISDIDALAAKGASGISLEGNTFACSVGNAREGDYLAVRLPYSAGWSATVNGAPAEIVRSNIGFMAIRLPEGATDIVMTFETPNLRTGLALSCIGILAAAAICLVPRAMRRKRPVSDAGSRA